MMMRWPGPLHLVTAGRPHETHTHLHTGQSGEPALAWLQELLNRLGIPNLKMIQIDTYVNSYRVFQDNHQRLKGLQSFWYIAFTTNLCHILGDN